eukprot:610330-Prorocentrum_minimum.AAC.2
MSSKAEREVVSTQSVLPIDEMIARAYKAEFRGISCLVPADCAERGYVRDAHNSLLLGFYCTNVPL